MANNEHLQVNLGKYVANNDKNIIAKIIKISANNLSYQTITNNPFGATVGKQEAHVNRAGHAAGAGRG